MDKRKIRSYNAIVDLCNEEGLEVMFSIEEYRGQTEDINGKNVSVRYPVRCKECGQVYEAWFKTSSKRLMKCPNCHKGHRDVDVSYKEAINMCSEENHTPCFTADDWKGKSFEYNVKCNVCGFIHPTRFVNKIKNCPFCKGSKDPRVQLDKVRQVFKSNKLTLLEEEYKQTIIDGKRSKYKVRCDICGTEYYAAFIGHKTTNCPKCCERKQRSNRERLMQSFLEDSGLRVFPNYRDGNLRVDGSVVELDLYLPDKGIAFEFNGQAYHNCGEGTYKKDKFYHRKKTLSCLSQGIKLYHIWDFVSDDLCKSLVSTKAGLNTKVYARNCTLQEISALEAKTFLNRCHVDGYVRSSKFYALFYEGRIVACLTLLNRAIQSGKVSAWEIGRFASELGVTVVGGYSKLLTYAEKYLRSIGVRELVSYCNRDISPDPYSTFYYKNGFTYLGDSGLIYWYWASRALSFLGKKIAHSSKVSRQSMQKSKLLQFYKDEGLEPPSPCTELTLTSNIGLYPCYNSGNFKYIKSL